MNFSKLSKEKKQHLALIGLVTVAVLAGLGWGLIKGQYEYIHRMAEKRVSTEKKLHTTEEAIKRSGQIEAELSENKKKLDVLEADMASGDLYSWMLNSLRKFSADYKVEIPQKSGISDLAQVTLLPNFPYKQVSITVMGTAHYHELGRFISDFENEFPHVRLLNLGIELVPTSSGERELLTFKMEIVTLVKSNPS
jgi:Tfp pilus assembly protein PilO